MHLITERILKQREALSQAAILAPLDEDFAIMISYVEANEFYNDLVAHPAGFEIYYYRDLSAPPVKERTHYSSSHIGRPPFPSRDHNIWCSFEGITLIIKGMKDE